jgi:hypothetical protein
MVCHSPSLGARMTVFLATAVPGHLLWETAQLPLYTIWSTGSLREILVAAVHCTGGDILITAATLGIAIAFVRLCRWTPFGGRMVVSVIALGIAYTILSEWLNVKLWRSWAYAPAMPVLPGTGTGLAPLLQWLIVPSLALAITLSSTPMPPKSQQPLERKGR